MPRRIILVAASIAAAFFASSVFAAGDSLIPETTAARHGLTRPWFVKVDLDSNRTDTRDVLFFEDAFYAQSKSGMVFAFDAETGKALWSKQVGQPNNPLLPLGARGELLAMVSGSRLYVMNRRNGDLLYEKRLDHAPGSGPAVSSHRVYVPTIDGLIVAYRIQKPDTAKADGSKPAADAAKAESSGSKLRLSQKYEPTLSCKANGRALIQPLITRDDLGGEYIVWPTDKGYLNFARIDREADNALIMKFRLQASEPIVDQPAYLPPDPNSLGDAGVVFAASTDGFIYAVQEETGSTLWRFSTGEPIIESPTAIDGRVYITTQIGGMYCLDSKTGENLWYSPGIREFVAASKSRIYTRDELGALVVLSPRNGARIDAIPLARNVTAIANPANDRIYLVDNTGLIQCLHEIALSAPAEHDKVRRDAAKAGTMRKVEEPKPVVEETPKATDTPKPKSQDPLPRPKAPTVRKPKADVEKPEKPVKKQRTPHKRGKKGDDEEMDNAGGGNGFGFDNPGNEKGNNQKGKNNRKKPVRVKGGNEDADGGNGGGGNGDDAGGNGGGNNDNPF